jgi:hypothetical protein
MNMGSVEKGAVKSVRENCRSVHFVPLPDHENTQGGPPDSGRRFFNGIALLVISKTALHKADLVADFRLLRATECPYQRVVWAD